MSDLFNPFIVELSDRLRGRLPAHEAHRKMMSGRLPLEDLTEQLKQARQSAVMILLYPHEQDLHTVFIQRTSYKGVHSGQIAFPGGKYELNDKDLEQTALRETEEEVAVLASQVQTLGKISPLYVPPSNFLINPYVGFHKGRPNFKAEPTEVAQILEAPLIDLLGEDSLQDHKVKTSEGHILNVKGFPIQDKIIWGATAMILKEFVELVEELRSPISLRGSR